MRAGCGDLGYRVVILGRAGHNRGCGSRDVIPQARRGWSRECRGRGEQRAQA